MRRIVGVALLLSLCACAKPVPFNTAALLPPDTVYDQTSSNFYLKHKVTVGDFAYDGDNKQYGDVAFSNFHLAVEQALRKGGYLAPAGSANYRLTGNIKDVKVPRCFFGSCDSGTAVEYTLTNIHTGDVAYSELLVVPYTTECPVFMNDATPYIIQAYTQSVGANIAQLIQVLNRKTSATLK